MDTKAKQRLTANRREYGPLEADGGSRPQVQMDKREKLSGRENRRDYSRPFAVEVFGVFAVDFTFRRSSLSV
jgi:hypothetical protein